jgi:hypothetical protein
MKSRDKSLGLRLIESPDLIGTRMSENTMSDIGSIIQLLEYQLN